VLANISAAVLVELAPPIVRCARTAVEAKTRLILSGFLDEQEPAVRTAFEPLETIEQIGRDGWRALALR
jgi:ribosomal protein L11 methylase PrmA